MIVYFTSALSQIIVKTFIKITIQTQQMKIKLFYLTIKMLLIRQIFYHNSMIHFFKINMT
jgi:hypothetical protein